MAINLATKYAKKVADKFYLDSVIVGKTNRDYDWDGVKSINVYTITTQTTNNYNRTASANRYGTPSEVQDTIQTMQITQDKSVSLVVDKGNNTEQMMVKNAGKVVALEQREQFIPEFDKYCLAAFNTGRGQYTVDASITKSNIVDAIGSHAAKLGNAKASLDDATTFIGWSNYAKLVSAPEFLHIEKLGVSTQEKGVLGMCRGLKIAAIPDDYLPEGVNFMTVKRSSVIAPTKIKDINLHVDPPGISGNLMEIRWLYDAFVLTAKKDGVVVSLTEAPSA